MQPTDEYRRTAQYVDVVTGNYDTERTVYRFPNDEEGHARAVAYRNAYNASLREGMKIPEADLEMQKPDWGQRPGEYERADRVATYYSNRAGLDYVHLPPVVANEAPMPTDYPHEF